MADPDPSTPEFTAALLQSLVKGTSASNELATADQHSFASTYPAYAATLEGLGERLTTMLQGLMQQQQQSSAAAESFSGMDDDDRFEAVVDMSDRLLEQVDANLDAARGVSNATEKQAKQASKHAAKPLADKSKPQSQWADDVNNSDEPFVPKLRSKPNAVQPLKKTLVRSDEEPSQPSSRGETRPQPEMWYAHPYAAEIDAFHPTEAQLLPPAKERLFPPMHTTPCTWVATEAALLALVAKLRGVDEVALDLEHHSQRSYRGFVCLMQISTREEDFLVDTLALRTSLHVLNETLTDPRVTKVVHGAESDVAWLQRDFGLYLVGAFDTGQAARVLELPAFSLAHLLKKVCGVEADKSHQLADWRVRPLTEEMLRYARGDTHYLLHVYDRLKADLKAQGASVCAAAWERSAAVCRAPFRWPVFDAEFGSNKLITRAGKSLTPQQQALHLALFAWRDLTARQDDESCDHVLPNYMLMQLARAAPRTRAELLA
eukprot:scaffold33188_cov63-Phaeocystis_antarctica.AAC.4